VALDNNIDPRIIEVSKLLTRFMSTDSQLATLTKVVMHANEVLSSVKYFEPEATVLRSVAALIDAGKPPIMGDIADRINEVEERMHWQRFSAKEVAKVLRGLQLLIGRRFVSEKGSSYIMLIVEGRYIKDLIDRMAEFNVRVPGILQEQYEKQLKEMYL